MDSGKKGIGRVEEFEPYQFSKRLQQNNRDYLKHFLCVQPQVNTESSPLGKLLNQTA